MGSLHLGFRYNKHSTEFSEAQLRRYVTLEVAIKSHPRQLKSKKTVVELVKTRLTAVFLSCGDMCYCAIFFTLW